MFDSVMDYASRSQCGYEGFDISRHNEREKKCNYEKQSSLSIITKNNYGQWDVAKLKKDFFQPSMFHLSMA